MPIVNGPSLEGSSFVFVKSVAGVRLENRNARIIQMARDYYCVYPSLSGVSADDLGKALVELDVIAHRKPGKKYADLGKDRQDLIVSLFSSGHSIVTWDNYLRKSSGIGGKTNGAVLEEYRVAYDHAARFRSETDFSIEF